jgi:hypothetical protein
MFMIFFALVGLASAANPEGQTASWLDPTSWSVRHWLIACFLLYRLYSLLGGGGMSAEDKKFSADFLEKNKAKEGVIALPSGLQYKVLRAGKGNSHPLPDSPCACHYEGRCCKDWPAGKKFDSSYDRGAPTTFAPNQVSCITQRCLQLSFLSRLTTPPFGCASRSSRDGLRPCN